MSPPPNAHRDLLFGLLALQTGMIDQGNLFTAFNAWARGKERTIAEILVEQGLSSERKTLLEALVAEHLAQHGGDPEKSLAALEIEGSTREMLSKIENTSLDLSLHLVTLQETENDLTIDIGPTLTSRLGSGQGDEDVRYRVIRKHREGGQGIVFLASEAELNRQVALKQLHAKHADDEQTRQRFIREAEITAGLEHPNIVPVYGLGVYRDGRPFYAMRFVRGDSLKDAIIRYHANKKEAKLDKEAKHRSSPALELSKLLRRFLDVCNAIEYAHKRGVFHRDIKPGNIIVGKYGETLLVDWGLAKASGEVSTETSVTEGALTPSKASGSGATMPHSKIGTPAYMSPEQASGDLERVGELSDVYGLGASLYHLLVGQPAFTGRQQEQVLEAVRKGNFPGPRAIDPSIDRALEAVCLKAMALNPEDRYQSPRLLADDIERWLADDPVSAYPEKWPRKVARWSRRHSSLVASAGIALVCGLVAFGVITWLVSRQNARLVAANEEISRQHDRAEASGVLARKAVNEMLHEVAHQDLLNIPQGELVRLRLAERAAAFIRQLDGLSSNDPATLYDEARILDEVGSIYRLVAKYPQSAEEFTAGIAILEKLLKGDPSNSSYSETLAHIESQYGELIRLRGGPFTEREPHYRRAVSLASDLRKLNPAKSDYIKIHATTLNDLANSLSIAARDAEAEPFSRDAVAAAIEYRRSLPEKPDPNQFQMGYMILPMCSATCGEILMKLGRNDWEPYLTHAIDESRQLQQVYPTSQDAPFILVESSRTLIAAKTRDNANVADALRSLDQHVTMITDLTSNYPSVRVYQRHIERLRIDRAALRIRANQLPGAEDDLVFAHERLSKRTNQESKSIPVLQDFAKVKGQYARLYQKRNDPRKAGDWIKQAIELHDRALSIEPENRAVAQQRAADEAFEKSLAGR